jgi:hypothetical protein
MRYNQKLRLSCESGGFVVDAAKPGARMVTAIGFPADQERAMGLPILRLSSIAARVAPRRNRWKSSYVLAIAMLLFGRVPVRAGEPTKSPTSHVVGSVYGKAITAADIGLTAPIDPAIRFDARDKERWELRGRIAQAFGKPVADRFVRERKIDATADEIEEFKISTWEANERQFREGEIRLRKIEAELAAENLPEEKRAKLHAERDRLERYVARRHDRRDREVPDSLARQFIVAWKTERELHRAYLGRVIFQQFGPEALDARRRLYEEAEKKGDLKFDDAGVRHLFYYYYVHVKHVAMDGEVLEKPWFLRDGD